MSCLISGYLAAECTHQTTAMSRGAGARGYSLCGERAEHLGQNCPGRKLRLEVVERQLPQAVERELCFA